MKITSWNVNSVRARILNIKDYIKLSNPDILMIQEIKTEEKSSKNRLYIKFQFNKSIKDVYR